MTINMELAPIVLFTYCRPWHTEQTLNALKKNTLASQSRLFIYHDGLRENATAEACENHKKVGELIRSKDWCGQVEVIDSLENKGLATSIRSGVTETIDRFGKVIVLEDDLVTSSAFLTYMNKALDFYEKRHSVFSISGYCLPTKKMQIPEDYPYDVFVGLRNSSWGWATWKDRWDQVDWDVPSYKTILESSYMQQAFNRGGDDVFELLQKQQTGELDIWSVQFTIAHFINHAISIIPVKSYVNNIGMDGSGENTLPTKSLDHEYLCNKNEIKFIEILYQDSRLINSFYSAYCRKKRRTWQKVINRVVRLLGKPNIYNIKKSVYCR